MYLVVCFNTLFNSATVIKCCINGPSLQRKKNQTANQKGQCYSMRKACVTIVQYLLSRTVQWSDHSIIQQQFDGVTVLQSDSLMVQQSDMFRKQAIFKCLIMFLKWISKLHERSVSGVQFLLPELKGKGAEVLTDIHVYFHS